MNYKIEKALQEVNKMKKTITTEEECPCCQGTGWDEQAGDKCDECGTEGVIITTHTEEIQVDKEGCSDCSHYHIHAISCIRGACNPHYNLKCKNNTHGKHILLKFKINTGVKR